MSTARSHTPLPLFDMAHQQRGISNSGSKVSHRYAAEQWRIQHPDGWALLESEAAAMVARGKRFGMKCLVEHVRWLMHYASASDQPAGTYRLNNNHTAYFARMLLADHPAWAQYIETREAGDQ